MEASVDDRTARGREYAGRVLRRIFGSIKPGLRYRLWDGTESAIGTPDGSFTLVIRDRETFRQTFSTSNTRLLAEAFVDNRIEVEGDLFAAMRVANALEDVELSLTDKLGILLDCRRV